MYRLKNISLFLFLAFASGLYAQSDSANQEGEIVMTKEELKSFLKTVAEAKLKKIEADKEMQDKLALAEARAYYYEQLSQRRPNNDYSSNANYNQFSQRDLALVIERLNSKLDNLSEKVNVAKKTDDVSVIYPDTKKDYLSLNQKFNELSDRLQNATVEERKSALESLLSEYGNFKKQVFFANDSSVISNSDVKYINDVVEVLKRYKELSIVIEGYASPVGSANYNKQLSMRRAEAVKSAIEAKGIAESRVVAAFKGEDHSGSEAHARRVDMSIIIK